MTQDEGFLLERVVGVSMTPTADTTEVEQLATTGRETTTSGA